MDHYDSRQSYSTDNELYQLMLFLIKRIYVSLYVFMCACDCMCVCVYAYMFLHTKNTGITLVLLAKRMEDTTTMI